jgi:hypothetical protein
MSRPVKTGRFGELSMGSNVYQLEPGEAARITRDNVRRLRARGVGHSRIASMLGLSPEKVAEILSDLEEQHEDDLPSD